MKEPAAAAASAKSLQSCPTLCDPMDCSLPGFSVPGILQARTLEWVAISFSNAWKWKVKVKSLSRVWLLATPWTAAYQAPPSMGLSGQQYWSGVPLPSPMKEPSEHRRCVAHQKGVLTPRIGGHSLPHPSVPQSQCLSEHTLGWQTSWGTPLPPAVYIHWICPGGGLHLPPRPPALVTNAESPWYLGAWEEERWGITKAWFPWIF